IARMNELGLMKVGPQSAGADPGPACYGRGGSEPTVTDANVLLGYLAPGSFLGGSMTLDVEAAAAAVGRLADRLGLDAIRTARAEISLDGDDTLTVERAVDMRYVGQAHEITVRLPAPPTDPAIEAVLRTSFDETYRGLYSVLNDSFEVEVLNWRVRVSAPSTDLWFESADDAADERSSRQAWDEKSRSFVEAPVHRQAGMDGGLTLAGPLIVEQRETT